jgi:hypothetical protein
MVEPARHTRQHAGVGQLHLPSRPRHAGPTPERRAVRAGRGEGAPLASRPRWPAALPDPRPASLGLPGAGYPFHWSFYKWLPGEAADRGQLADPLGIAADVARLLDFLRRIDAVHGPQAGVHNWFRGATLRTYDSTARSALAELDRLGDHLDVDLAACAWDDALQLGGTGWTAGSTATSPPAICCSKETGSSGSSTSAPAVSVTRPAPLPSPDPSAASSRQVVDAIVDDYRATRSSGAASLET